MSTSTTAAPLTRKEVKGQVAALRAKVNAHHEAHLKHHAATSTALDEIESCLDDATFPGDNDQSDDSSF